MQNDVIDNFYAAKLASTFLSSPSHKPRRKHAAESWSRRVLRVLKNALIRRQEMRTARAIADLPSHLRRDIGLDPSDVKSKHYPVSYTHLTLPTKA